MVFPVGADELKAEGKAVFAESDGKRHGRRADKGPRRTIFGIAGIAQAFRRLAKGRQRQHSVEAADVSCEARPQSFLQLFGGEIVISRVGLSRLNKLLQFAAGAVGDRGAPGRCG